MVKTEHPSPVLNSGPPEFLSASSRGGGKTLLSTLTPLPRPMWLPEKVWPFQTRGLEVDGTVIAVTEVGQGPTLLFVHTGFWSLIWRDVITRLAGEFRCICLDAPGTGQSARRAHQAITLSHASRAVAGVIETLRLEDFTIVVHDLGGPAGLAAVAEAPERLRAIVAVNAFAWRPTGAVFRGMLALMGSGLVREFDAWTQFLPRVTASTFGVARSMDAATVRAFRAGIGHEGLRSFHYYMRDARKNEDLYLHLSQAFAGPLRGLPLLTIFGEYNDPLKFQPKWKALFPGVTQVIVPKGNHFPMCDNPELVAQTIRSWHWEKVKLHSGSKPQTKEK